MKKYLILNIKKLWKIEESSYEKGKLWEEF